MSRRLFKRQTYLARALRAAARRAFDIIENNGDCRFASNGEKRFLEAMLSHFAASASSSATHPLHMLDVGACRGDYSRIVLDVADRLGLRVHLHLFEPLSANFPLLKSRLGDRPNLILNQVAISDVEAEMPIYFNRSRLGLTSLYRRDLKAQGMELDEVEMVNTVRLDSYLSRFSLEHVPFIKLDVEGREMAVLESLGSYLDGDFVDFLAFEYGGADLDSRTSLAMLYGKLERAGFVVAKVMRKGLELRPYKPWMDNFTYANYVAVSRQVLGSVAPELIGL